jgi:SAM-dependent methyltransferase
MMVVDVERINHPSLSLAYGGFSRSLQRWIWKSPHQRYGIVQVLHQFSRQLREGSRVLDAGAGSAPYRELFRHCRYTTSDHVQRTPPVDLVCPVDAIPLPDRTFDAAVCTEVLEHVPDPVAALRELRRLLVPGGHVCVTMPFMLGVHEAHDYSRLTAAGLRRSLELAGLEVVAITPRYGLPMTLWSLVWAVAIRLAHPERNMPPARAIGRFLLGLPMLVLSVVSFFPLRAFDVLDRTQEFTLGYAAIAKRRAVDDEPAASLT